MNSVFLVVALAAAAASQPARVPQAPASQGANQPSQVAAKAAPAPSVPVYKPAPPITREAFDEIEKGFDHKLDVLDPTAPFDLIGDTRGIYLPGYGVVFTTELSLVKSIGGPFMRVYPQSLKDQTHEAMVKHLPVLRKALQDQMKMLAEKLVSLPPNERIVLSVRLLYQSWQITSGLPGEIVLTADRKSALAGPIQVDEH